MIARQKNVEREMCKRMLNLNYDDAGKTKSIKAIDSNNNETKDLIMEEKSSLEKSKDLIIKKIK
jgi:hypothetical protein